MEVFAAVSFECQCYLWLYFWSCTSLEFQVSFCLDWKIFWDFTDLKCNLYTLADDNLWSAVLRRIFCCCIPVRIIFSKAMFWNALMDWLLVVGLYTIYITLSVLNEGKFSIVFNNFEFMFKANLSLLAN